MAPKNRIIFDTDPGVDDTLAMLLALAAKSEELEVVMISATYGNVPLSSTLRNVVTLFHVLDKEMEWRKSQGQPQGFEALRAYKPIVSMGPEHALEDEILMADYFHGLDGLHGVHEAHPHLSPADTWKSLFHDGVPGAAEDPSFYSYFTASKAPAHKEIIRILKEEPENTITIVAVGPLTNVALAAAEDPEAFLRVKEVVVMGGAVDCPGNVTPVAEFNTYADAVATARVFALTSPTPASTMPPVPKDKTTLPPYPEKLSKRLNLSLFPLDITTSHQLRKKAFNDALAPHLAGGSPLATWVNSWMSATFSHIEEIVGADTDEGLSLHDPLTVWYMITQSDPAWTLAKTAPEDIRIETSGQWTHGMHVADRRGRKRAGEGTAAGMEGGNVVLVEEIPGDDLGWLSQKRGNRINRWVASPGADAFAPDLLKRIFG